MYTCIKCIKRLISHSNIVWPTWVDLPFCTVMQYIGLNMLNISQIPRTGLEFSKILFLSLNFWPKSKIWVVWLAKNVTYCSCSSWQRRRMTPWTLAYSQELSRISPWTFKNSSPGALHTLQLHLIAFFISDNSMALIMLMVEGSHNGNQGDLSVKITWCDHGCKLIWCDIQALKGIF